jgi:hypothetical protein
MNMIPPLSFRLPGLALLLPLLSAGCATYEYDIVRPEPLATHVGRKQEAKVTLDPLDYRFISYENHLILRIHNPTDDPIQLLGQQSAAIDPNGESHPLRTLTIAPGTFVKLILPPPRPQVYDEGPYIGFGVGVFGRADPRDGWRDNRLADIDQPRYYTVYDEANNFYWEWTKESDARLLLTYQRGNSTFHHEFTFRRVKV